MLEILVVAAPVALAFLVGNAIEKAHFRSLAEREAGLRRVPMVTGKRFVEEGRQVTKAELVSGNVVLGQDAFKRLLGSLVNLFGGHMAGLEALLDRGRREAILRMLESATNADVILNVRLQTSTIGLNGEGAPEGNAEVLAYGTAIYYR